MIQRYDPGYTLGQPRQPRCSMIEAADGAWVSWDDVWRLMGERDRERDAGNAEVAALRAEVERLRAGLMKAEAGLADSAGAADHPKLDAAWHRAKSKATIEHVRRALYPENRAALAAEAEARQ